MPHCKTRGPAFQRGFVRYVGTSNHLQWLSCLSHFCDPCALLINQSHLCSGGTYVTMSSTSISAATRAGRAPITGRRDEQGT
jgi:hypothetical protein